MKDLTFLFRLKGILDDHYDSHSNRLRIIEDLVNDQLYPMEYEGERRYTEAFIQLVDRLMTDHGITEEQAYRHLYKCRDPEQCDLDAAIEDLERHTKFFTREDL